MFEVDLPGARAVFTTRSGGHSEGPFASRNLGVKTDDDPDIVARNLDGLKGELEVSSLQLLHQVHGAQLTEVGRRDADRLPLADGASTTEDQHALLITGADCPSVFMATQDRLTALHCGWRPVAAGLIETGAAGFGGASFDAVVGPGICQEHFEVGPEVVEAMGEDGAKFADGRQLDLVGLISHRLERAGARHVHVVERCTFCEPDLFFSHRRDAGVTGRQAGLAWRI